MTKFMSLKQAASETCISEYTLRLWCKQKKIRFNIAGNTKYILRLDWLEEDLQHMALKNVRNSNNSNDCYGKLRKAKE